MKWGRRLATARALASGLRRVEGKRAWFCGEPYLASDGETGAFRCPDRFSVVQFASGWEEAVAGVVRALKGGDLFVDVGANIGRHSALAASTGARVLAFEPSPGVYPYLKHNLAGWPLAEAVPLAVWDSDGSAQFGRHAHSDKGTLEAAAVDGEAVEPAGEVRTVRLDSWLADRGYRPSLVKSDTEGSDSRVLRGLRGTLESDKPRVVFEAMTARAFSLCAAELPGYHITILDGTNYLGVPK